MKSFVLGADGNERVELTVLSYERPASGEYYDDNWLSCEVKVQAGAFSGKYSASFLTSEVHRLNEDLQHLYRELKGEVVFESMEGQLELSFSCDNLGHIRVSGTAIDQAGIGHKLCFTLLFDQTCLAKSLAGLTEVVGAFPVRT